MDFQKRFALNSRAAELELPARPGEPRSLRRLDPRRNTASRCGPEGERHIRLRAEPGQPRPQVLPVGRAYPPGSPSRSRCPVSPCTWNTPTIFVEVLFERYVLTAGAGLAPPGVSAIAAPPPACERVVRGRLPTPCNQRPERALPRKRSGRG